MLNIVTNAPGEAAPIGDELVENPHVRRLNFTGSTGTGRKLAEAAGRQLKRIVLELGGYNPLIVLGDADIEYAVNATAFGAFLHQGQICMSARRIIVERSISDEFVSRLVEKTNGLKAGDPNEHDTIIGPVINDEALQMIKRRVDGAVSAGAKVLAGGEAVGPCYRATLLGDVPPDSEFAQTETFGPVAAIEIVDSAEEAVVRANASSYGLSSGIITQDSRPRPRARGADRRRHRARQRPARRRRAADAVRRRQGLGLRPLRRQRRGRRVHRAALGHGPARIASLPVLR